MITEIEVEGIGTMRQLNAYQQRTLRTMAPARRAVAELAFGLGMLVRQFQSLSPEQQSAARVARNRLQGSDRSQTEYQPQAAPLDQSLYRIIQ